MKLFVVIGLPNLLPTGCVSVAIKIKSTAGLLIKPRPSERKMTVKRDQDG